MDFNGQTPGDAARHVIMVRISLSVPARRWGPMPDFTPLDTRPGMADNRDDTGFSCTEPVFDRENTAKLERIMPNRRESRLGRPSASDPASPDVPGL